MQMLGSAKGWLFPVSVTYKSGKSQTPGQLSRHFMLHEPPLGLLTTPRQLLPDPLVPPVSYPLPGEKEGFGQASKWWIVPSPAPTEALLQGLLWTEVRNAPPYSCFFHSGLPKRKYHSSPNTTCLQRYRSHHDFSGINFPLCLHILIETKPYV